MAALSEIGIYILQTLGGIYLLIVLLRFLLQLAKGDFYNPISQFIIKATNAPLRPMRKVIPGIGGIDWACLLLALIIQFF